MKIGTGILKILSHSALNLKIISRRMSPEDEKMESPDLDITASEPYINQPGLKPTYRRSK